MLPSLVFSQAWLLNSLSAVWSNRWLLFMLITSLEHRSEISGFQRRMCLKTPVTTRHKKISQLIAPPPTDKHIFIQSKNWLIQRIHVFPEDESYMLLEIRPAVNSFFLAVIKRTFCRTGTLSSWKVCLISFWQKNSETRAELNDHSV